MTARVEGIEKLISKLTDIPRRVEASVTTELRDIGEDLLKESQERAPFEEGDLRGAGYSRVERGAGGPELEVGYSGLPYIIVQHEGGWLNFLGDQGPKEIQNYSTPGTSSKFLESSWVEGLPDYKQRLRAATQEALRG